MEMEGKKSSYIYIYIHNEATCKLTMRRYVSTVRKNVNVFQKLATSVKKKTN